MSFSYGIRAKNIWGGGGCRSIIFSYPLQSNLRMNGFSFVKNDRLEREPQPGPRSWMLGLLPLLDMRCSYNKIIFGAQWRAKNKGQKDLEGF